MKKKTANKLARMGIKGEEFERLLQAQRSGRAGKPCTLCDDVVEVKKFYGKPYCNRCMWKAKRLHKQFTNPVGRYGARTGG